MVKAIIFDFDNVIGMSEKSRFQILQSAARKYGIKILKSDFSKKIGNTSEAFLNIILKANDLSKLSMIRNDYKEELKNNLVKYIKPNKDIVSFIKEYNGSMQFGIATTSSQEEIDELIKAYGIFDKFTSIIAREEIKNLKPHPEIYLKAAKELDLTHETCVVIEDSVIGAQSALAAGMQCFVYLNGLNNKREFTNLAIDGFISSKKDLAAIC